jgi:hypothetical protein
MIESNTLLNSKRRNERWLQMDREYEATQKEIDKLLNETSQEYSHKKYKGMKKDKNYNEKMKKIAKLTLQLKEEI